MSPRLECSTFKVLNPVGSQHETMGDPRPQLAVALGTASSAIWLLLGPVSSSQIQMGSEKGRQGRAWLAEGWEHGLEAGFGFGPHPACLPLLAAGPPATSTLGSEVGAEHSLPLWLPPLGRFRDLLQPQHFSACPREARPAWKLNLTLRAFRTAYLQNPQSRHPPRCLRVFMPPVRFTGSSEGEGPIHLGSNPFPTTNMQCQLGQMTSPL